MSRRFTLLAKLTSLILIMTGSLTLGHSQTVNITFQVDMSNEANPNDVQVVIKNPWIWTPLTDQGNGIWSGTVEVDANGTYPYTFVNGGQDNWDEEESVPGVCNYGSESAPERRITVEGDDVVVDVVEFGGCNETEDTRVDVTLQVDLDDGDGFVENGGAWVFMDSDWTEWYDLSDEDGDGVYSVTLKQEPGAALTYRFSYQNGPDPNYDYTEEIVPAECANDDGFRTLTVPAHDVSMDEVDYEQCSGEPIEITLQVDLNYVEDFVDNGAAWVFMDAGWYEWYEMTDEDGDGIFEFTVERMSGETLTYRFSYQNGPDPYYDYTEEPVPDGCSDDGGFREFVVPPSDVTLPAFVYGSCDNNPTPMVKITFRVDMSDVENANDVQVVIKDPWVWTAMTDEGNGIWTATVEMNGNNTYPYTFVNGGQDNWDEEESVPEECNFGSPDAPERHISVEDSDVEVELVAFGRCATTTSIRDIEWKAVNVFPNPASDYLNVNAGGERIESIELIDYSGRLVTSLRYGQDIQVRIDVTELSSGMYFIRAQTTGGQMQGKIVID